MIRESAPPEFLAANLDLPPLATQLLWNRGITERADAERFLNPNYQTDLHDPFAFCHMARAVARIRQAITQREHIVVHGDYDADGVCGAAVIWTTLKALGAHVDVFLPHREHDGYGMHERTVHELKGRGASVIITCDCGISNGKEIALAQRFGIDVIITDHHTLPPELPPAFAILHPGAPGETYPWKGLSGGGVAFKLAQALLRECGVPEPGFEKWLLDLVAISSVADMVPLQKETRALVHFGLKVLCRTRRRGLQRLMQSAGVLDDAGRPKRALDATTIGFVVAPRINAAGRMAHATTAFNMLTTENATEAEELAHELEQHNSARQQAVARLLEEAKARAGEIGPEPAVVVSAPDWPLGLLGLIASKLAETHRRPAFIFSNRGGILTGSGRSVAGINLMQALRELPPVMTKFGGHAQACGVTLPEAALTQFTDALRTRLMLETRAADDAPRIADAALLPGDITDDLPQMLQRFAPFGVENPEPVFVLRGTRVLQCNTVGASGKHLKLYLSVSGRIVKGIAFGMGSRASELLRSQTMDIVCAVRANDWNGRREVELFVIDFNSSDLP